MKINTEKTGPASKGIEDKPLAEALRLMLSEERSVAGVVEKALKDIEKAVESAVATIKDGGRVFYIGAGTSGRLGVLDASEIMPTFGTNPFRAIMAGGMRAVHKAAEGAEDDIKAGIKAASKIKARDMAVGISASGKTAFVLSALEKAKSNGARCRLIACNRVDYPFLDGKILLLTGAEVIAGSTRMKAATATKLALNMLSTATMIKLGHVYDGMMIDVVPSNVKLIARAEGIIMKITGCSKQTASRFLRLSGMRPKTAAVMIKKKVSKRKADRLLREAGGFLREAVK